VAPLFRGTLRAIAVMGAGLLGFASVPEARARSESLRVLLANPTVREIFWIVSETPEGVSYFRYSGDAIRYRFRPDLAASDNLSHILSQLNRIDIAMAEAAPELTKVARSLVKIRRELELRGLITRHGRIKDGALRYIDRAVRTLFTMGPQEIEFAALMERSAERGVTSYSEARELFLDVEGWNPVELTAEMASP